MLGKYTYFVMICALLGGLAWWSDQVEAPPAPLPVEIPVHERAVDRTRRRELIETLDRIVAYERYYRSVYGHFTQLLSRVGVQVPSAVSDHFEIRVAEASGDRLLVTAFSEVNGRIVDRVSIDQSYRLKATFEIPPPRPEYLKVQALKHLRALRDSPDGAPPLAEQGVFSGYFDYAIRRDSESRKTAFAVGIRHPVSGARVELGPREAESTDGVGQLTEVLGQVAEGVRDGLEPTRPGEKPSNREIASTLEEAYLAQRIFYGEMGRYARSWAELSKIAAFRFEGKDQYTSAVVPFGDLPTDLEVESADQERPRAERRITSTSEGLEIEPVRGSDAGS
jgi:hypothetical protein